jgi:serine/threonine protein kinase
VQELMGSLQDELQEGQVKVHDVLGRGAFGTVYRGEWRGLPVAIKTVVFQSTASDDQLALIASEAAISSSLVHHNIVATYAHDVKHITSESGLDAGLFKFHLIQEYCSGGTLREAIDCSLLRQLPGRWDVIVNILADIASGMSYMHTNRICHSDLNPANVLLKVRCRPQVRWSD